MRKSRFNESQILWILNEADAGLPQARDQPAGVLQLEVEVRRRVGLRPQASQGA